MVFDRDLTELALDEHLKDLRQIEKNKKLLSKVCLAVLSVMKIRFKV